MAKKKTSKIIFLKVKKESRIKKRKIETKCRITKKMETFDSTHLCNKNRKDKNKINEINIDNVLKTEVSSENEKFNNKYMNLENSKTSLTNSISNYNNTNSSIRNTNTSLFIFSQNQPTHLQLNSIYNTDPNKNTVISFCKDNLKKPSPNKSDEMMSNECNINKATTKNVFKNHTDIDPEKGKILHSNLKSIIFQNDTLIKTESKLTNFTTITKNKSSVLLENNNLEEVLFINYSSNETCSNKYIKEVESIDNDQDESNNRIEAHEKEVHKQMKIIMKNREHEIFENIHISCNGTKNTNICNKNSNTFINDMSSSNNKAIKKEKYKSCNNESTTPINVSCVISQSSNVNDLMFLSHKTSENSENNGYPIVDNGFHIFNNSSIVIKKPLISFSNHQGIENDLNISGKGKRKNARKKNIFPKNEISIEKKNSNKKEHKHPLNLAFTRLKEMVPRLPSDKLSKIQTIKLATHYIDFLFKLNRDGDGEMNGKKDGESEDSDEIYGICEDRFIENTDNECEIEGNVDVVVQMAKK